MRTLRIQQSVALEDDCSRHGEMTGLSSKDPSKDTPLAPQASVLDGVLSFAALLRFRRYSSSCCVKGISVTYDHYTARHSDGARVLRLSPFIGNI